MSLLEGDKEDVFCFVANFERAVVLPFILCFLSLFKSLEDEVEDEEEEGDDEKDWAGIEDKLLLITSFALGSRATCKTDFDFIRMEEIT